MNSSGHARVRTTNQAVWLALALVIVGILGGLLGYTFEGVDAVIAAGLALGVCLATGVAALVLSARLHQPELALYQILINQVLRAGVPLGICFLVHSRGGTLAEAGFVFYVVALYLTTLVVDAFFLTNRMHAANCE